MIIPSSSVAFQLAVSFKQVLQSGPSEFPHLLCFVLSKVDDDVMMTLEKQKFCLCEAVLMLDAKVWKEMRKAWYNVVVEGIMKDYESKKILAQVEHFFYFGSRRQPHP